MSWYLLTWMLIGWLFFSLALCDCHFTDAGYTAEGTHGLGLNAVEGMWLGLILSAGTSARTWDNYRNPGVSAFLTSLYVVFFALIAISLGRQA